MENAKYIVSTEYDGKPRKLYEKTCIVCSRIFLVPKHRYTRKTCSAICNGKIQRKRIVIACTNCGKKVERTLNKVSSVKHGYHFCSRLCKDLSQRLDGNCPSIRPLHYGNGNGKYTYREKTLAKAKVCCCGETRIYLLTVHHRDGNRENNDSSNLETVCFNCHAIRHLKKNKDGEWYVSFSTLTSEEDIKILSSQKYIGDMV